MHPLKLKIIDYCLSMPHTEEAFPFDSHTWVAKVYGKMFALIDILEDDVNINLKCRPERAEELRAAYDFIRGGYHMSKKHWNTIYCSETIVDWLFLKELIDHSYEQVVLTIPKSKRI